MDFHCLLSHLNPTTLAIFAVSLLSYFLLKTVTNPHNAKKPPEAAGGWPVIGHLRLLSGPELPHITLGALADKYGPIFTIRVGVHRSLVVSNREIAKEIFTTHDIAVSSRPKLVVGKIMGYDYANFGFCPYNAYWRELRKITASELLSNRRLELLKDIKASEVEGFVKELYKLWTRKKSESGHVSVEMKQWLGDLNLNVILRMIAGKRYSCNNEEARQVKVTLREFFRLSGLFAVGDAIPFLGSLDFRGHEKAMKKAAKELDRVAEEWLEEHRRKRETGEADSRSHDFMDVLLSVLEGVELDGYDVGTVTKATSTTLLAGGTDTTTVTLTWTLALLLNNPGAMEKAQEELDKHVGRERLVTESDMENLVYLRAVVKESLRLCPAGPLSGLRVFSEGCTVGGYYVPKGMRLVVNLWKIQTDPSVWSDPLEFKPERFMGRHKDVDVKGQNFELIPFGAGRRSCPGIAFGLQMTQLVMASLLQAFDVARPTSAPIDMRGSPGLTNSKATPLDILLKPRLPHNLYQ